MVPGRVLLCREKPDRDNPGRNTPEEDALSPPALGCQEGSTDARAGPAQGRTGLWKASARTALVMTP